jgi:hypothetical protein
MAEGVFAASATLVALVVVFGLAQLLVGAACALLGKVP